MANPDQGPPQELFFRLSGAGDSPWEISRVQKVIVELIQRGVFQGEILDIGCGIGDNAIYIAKNAPSAKVTSIDLVPKAVEVARQKAEKENVNIHFEVVNMLQDLNTTTLKEHSFDVVLDSAIFHAFSDQDRPHYVKNIERLIKPGGLYVQICYSEKETRPGGPRRIRKSELNEIFSSANGWTIESIEDTVYESREDSPFGLVGHAYLSLIRRNKTSS